MQRKWLQLACRIGRCWLQPNHTPTLVRESYDRIAAGYDEAWTTHMRDLSLGMLDRLSPPPGSACLDLTCGTGFIAGELQRRTSGCVVGVDASAGMLDVARRRHPGCTFHHADAVAYLRGLPSHSLDVITCGWGLGYSHPFTIVREAARVLRPGGRLGIIDNALFSLAEVLWVSMLAFAETPASLTHVMRVRFLPGSALLAGMMRMCNLAVLHQSDGAKAYLVPDGRAAVARLTATGAAAGFEFACSPADRERIFDRFAELLDQRYRWRTGVPITHRYLMAVGKRGG